MTILHNDWGNYLKNEFSKPYYENLREKLKYEYTHETVFPDRNNIFNALHSTSYENTKVVILGQDPYHGPGQAHGLSFSVQPGVKIPPSLKNIYKELQADLGCPIPEHGYLQKWADQGVLLLNAVLTVRMKEPNSHKDIGWETFTDRVISALNERHHPVVFLLWGRHAQNKASFIDDRRHYVFRSPHPSPFSANRGFFGSRPFSKTNEVLQELGSEPIDWCLPKQVT
ncbi:uracil-DNA glycosylase [Texcoconibacillus texcoconensis]|uniref:Uracil-DNA glycosylase n=1 Tax=Texcoconibacillus texcoconensis TaxID=1095777 RepID=A0A840QS47_9BACI|nr:uracil-DNA glycosylase [Texcoconibacillus texcoconensis]MBB5174143.1 uracil-DNA glycosylase [Texcoconibacillus texcoconensis]